MGGIDKLDMMCHYASPHYDLQDGTSIFGYIHLCNNCHCLVFVQEKYEMA